jgi:hypothetical protein
MRRYTLYLFRFDQTSPCAFRVWQSNSRVELERLVEANRRILDRFFFTLRDDCKGHIPIQRTAMRRYHPDTDASTIPDGVLRSEWGRRNSAKRETRTGGHNGGRPGIPTACTCGVMCGSKRAAKLHCATSRS